MKTCRTRLDVIFQHHETITAAYAGLAGYPNGALLKAAAEAGFDVLVTGDKTLQ